MKPGLTRNELKRALPSAPDRIIEANIGNTDWNYVRPQKPITGVNDAFEQMQRRDSTGRKEIIQAAINTVQDMGPIWGNKEQPAKLVKKLVEYHEAKNATPANARAGQWFEIGGKRFFSRSLWERNYACTLEALKDRGFIKDWAYEPRTFWFEGIRRGTNNYKPDFLVTFQDGTEEYREVKGFMDKKSATKLKRMAKYFPGVRVRVIDGAWFKANGPVLSQIVPGWTKKGKKTVALKT